MPWLLVGAETDRPTINPLPHEDPSRHDARTWVNWQLDDLRLSVVNRRGWGAVRYISVDIANLAIFLLTLWLAWHAARWGLRGIARLEHLRTMSRLSRGLCAVCCYDVRTSPHN